jgi:translation initiation factor 2 subunit 2
MTETKINYSLSEEELIDRFYDKLKSLTTATKIGIPVPETKFLNKKLYFINFRDICSKINRDELFVLDYFQKETSAEITISAAGQMIINHMSRHMSTVNILKSFIKKYVQCPQCKSMNSKLEKKLGLYKLECKNCNAVTSVGSY